MILLEKNLDGALDQVERVLSSLCWVTGPETYGGRAIDGALRYHLGVRGGLIRARLALLSSDALDIPLVQAVRLAVVCEALHNASLIHDDLQDRALERRGRETVWSRFGPEIAVCLGDLLISAAYGALAEIDLGCDVSLLVRETHLAVTRAVHGQASDIRLSNAELEPDLALSSYLATARAKSGAILSLTLILPLAAAGHLRALEKARQAGEEFAVGYQVMDDLADFAEDRGDKSRPVRLNLLGLFKNESSFDSVREMALGIARQSFEVAGSLASELPGDSGRPLAAMADRFCRDFH